MSELTQLLSSRWPEVITFLLVLGRTSGLVISAPFWGGTVVPGLVRVVVAVSLSVAVYPLVKPPPPSQSLKDPSATLRQAQGDRVVGAALRGRPEEGKHIGLPLPIQQPFVLSSSKHEQGLSQRASGGPSLVSLLITLGGEILLGLILGWAAQLFFAGMRLAGQELEIKMGLGLAQLVDPREGGQTTIFSALFELMTALIFFSLNGHHFLIRALASSYSLFPLAGEGPVLSLVEGMVASAGGIFTIALRVSAPVVVGLLLSDIVLGIMSRAVPQMNIFLVALPLQLAFGVLLFLLSLPALVWFCVNQLSANGLFGLSGLFGPAR